MKRFDGKKAIVTGGSRGIGKAICQELHRLGAEVYALGKSQENLTELKTAFPEINTIQVDLVDWDTTRKAVDSINDVDILVNNAGIGKIHTLMEAGKDDFDAIMNVNLRSAFNISQVVARKMISRGCGGSIINISSINGTKPSPLIPLYSVSKAGLNMLTKVMALELGPHNIRVNSVAPTVVPTDMTNRFIAFKELSEPLMAQHPLGKFAELDDVVNAVVFLISDDATMITGTVLPVDGGLAIN